MCVCVSPCVSPWLRNLPVTAFDTLGSIMRFNERDIMISVVPVGIKKKIMHSDSKQLVSATWVLCFVTPLEKI